VADALGAAPAYLAATALSGQAGVEREFGSLSEGCRYLGGGVKAAEGGAQGRGGNGDDRAAQHRCRRQPLDAVRHQVGNWEQAAELEGCDEVASHGLVWCRRPGSIQPGGSYADQRLGRG
jgi:hypothetical protein